MEFVIGILIVVGIAYLLIRRTNKKEAGVAVEEAPYKVETQPTPVENTVAVAVALDLEGAESTIAKKPRAPRKPRTVAKATPAKKATAKKPAAKKATTKSKKA